MNEEQPPSPCSKAGGRSTGRPVFGRPRTISEIDSRIAGGRQRYLAAYFSGDEGQAQFWVREIVRLENYRNLLERRAAS